MTHDELVERVARTMCASVEARTSDVDVVRNLGFDSVQAFIDAAWQNYVVEARAAISVALKEAAKIAENKAEVLSQYRDTYAAVQAATAQDIADAILNLKGEE